MDVDQYPAGTPSWVDIGVPDMDAAVAFYGALFGWAFDPAAEETGGYRQARLRGRAVAGFGPATNPGPPVWTTYIATADADATQTAIEAAGGTTVLAVMDVMDFGRMGVYMDDSGTFFSTWQPGTHPGSQVFGEPGAPAWHELNTRNPDAAKAFYGTVFGWSTHDNPMEGFTYTEWKLGDHSVGGMMPMEGEEWEDLPSHWMVYFAVADTDAACARVGEFGGTVAVPPFDTPAGRMAVITDPAGAHFSIITLRSELTGS